MSKKVLMVIITLSCLVCVCFAFAADRLVIKNGANETTFSVADTGDVSTKGPIAVVKDAGNSDGLHYLGSFFRIPSGVGNGGLAFGYHANGTAPDYSFFYFPGGLDFSFNTYSGGMKNVLYAKASGEVGLGRSAPAYPLHMASGAYCSAGGVWTNASSRDYKQNIKDLDAATALKAVSELKPVSFVYKSEVSESHLGFIAEDVPEIVATKDRKGLSSMDVVALLTKVVQEQNATINALSSKVAQLESIVGSQQAGR